MVWESILFMFCISLGSVQIAASWADLKGMSFFRYEIAGYVFGALMVIGSFIWFFATVDFGEGGPKGQHDDQAVSVVLGGGSALLITLVLPSLMRLGSFCQPNEDELSVDGLEAFKENTLFQLIHYRWSRHKDGRG